MQLNTISTSKSFVHAPSSHFPTFMGDTGRNRNNRLIGNSFTQDDLRMLTTSQTPTPPSQSTSGFGSAGSGPNSGSGSSGCNGGGGGSGPYYLNESMSESSSGDSLPPRHNNTTRVQQRRTTG